MKWAASRSCRMTSGLSWPSSSLTTTILRHKVGVKVTLTASPISGYVVDHWTGTDDPSLTSLTNQMTMTADETVGVRFKALTGLTR